MLRDPEYFPESELFKPERWISNPHPPGYFPFGNGPRGCPGLYMAKAEVAALIAFFVTRYKWELKPGFKLETETSITPKPKNGIWCTCHERK